MDREQVDESQVPVPDYYRFGRATHSFDITDSLNLNYNRGCILKYLIRAGRKPGQSEAKDFCKLLRCAARELRRLGGEVPKDL